METVNFSCGHCSNLMAVSREYLGQHVRCPHCQQVVLAPAAEAAAPPPPPPPPPVGDIGQPLSIGPTPAEVESIFSSPEDDIFGSVPPRMGVSPGPSLPSGSVAWPSLELPRPAEQPPPAPAGESSVTFPQPEPAPAATQGYVQPAPEPAPVGTSSWPETAAEPTDQPAPDTTLSTIPPRTPRRSGGGWVIPLLIIPLISYAVFATIAVIILYLRLQQQHHPLEYVPDVDGENKGAKRQSSSIRIDMPRVDEPLPPHLKVGLGNATRVGDLEVTPLRVEWRRVWVHTKGYSELAEGRDDSLVLHLRLHNGSSDVVFKPMDPAFDRRWKEKKPDGRAPYTYLELRDGRRFYGGPIPWAPPRPKDPPPRETVMLREDDRKISQNYDQELKPGQTMDTFLCTDYDDHVGKALAGYQGPLVWRVRLRRGLVKVGDREVPATAVIGVEFTEQDIRKQG